MYNIAILEDDSKDRQVLLGYIEKYCLDKRIKAKTDLYPEPLKFLEMGKNIYDIVFMDIEMPHMDGMTVAKKLRQHDETAQIIFVTNLSHMAICGYEVSAFDFMVKPLKYTSFFMRMQRVISLIEKDKEHFIMVPLPYGTMRVAVSNIDFVDVRGHTLYFHTLTGVVDSRGKLSDYEAILGKYGFLRCSKCAIVNLKSIDKLTENSLIINENVVQISRNNRKSVSDALKASLGGKVYSTSEVNSTAGGGSIC